MVVLKRVNIGERYDRNLNMLVTAGRDSAVVREVGGAGQTEAARGPQVCKPSDNMVIFYFITKSHKTAQGTGHERHRSLRFRQ